MNLFLTEKKERMPTFIFVQIIIHNHKVCAIGAKTFRKSRNVIVSTSLQPRISTFHVLSKLQSGSGARKQQKPPSNKSSNVHPQTCVSLNPTASLESLTTSTIMEIS